MKDAVIKELLNTEVSLFTSKLIIERIPYIFNHDFDRYIEWKEKLSNLIEVDSKSISFTGSSAIGISLNPNKNFKVFDENSDIDIAIISSYHFDIAWHFLRNIGPRIYKLKPKERNAIIDHKERLIFWGTIATDKIIQLLPFGQKWVNAVTFMSREDPTSNKEINFRIYKDFEALRAYQVNNLIKIKDELIKGID